MNVREQARNELARLVLLGDPIPQMPAELIPDPWARKVWTVERRKVETMVDDKRQAWAAKRGIRGAPGWVKTPKRSSVRDEDARFYRRVWYERAVNGVCRCEECGKPITYAAAHISHNLSRGAWPEFRHDPRNVSILCVPHHRLFEDSHTRKLMRVYPRISEGMENLKRQAKCNRDRAHT